MTSREFRVWAPDRQGVELVLESDRHAMRRGDAGWWHVEAPVHADSTYAFSLDGGSPRPDPRGLRLPDGPHGFSGLFEPSQHQWRDQDWQGTSLESAVLYELHVGTFTPEGTLTAVAQRLDHLVDLGVTMVELLPLAPFPGTHGWGYDGVAPYAVHEAYGGPAALQELVDEAHGRSLGVCLDVVYNHLGPDGNYLPEFGPYLTDRYQTPWGHALNLDGPGSDEVRAWIRDNAVQWFRDFHVDALRLDAVHELIDNRAVHLLEELSATVDLLSAELGRSLWLVAEDDRNDSRTVTTRDRGGLGLHGQWTDDVHHGLHVALTGETQGYYADFATPDALPTVLRTPYFHQGSWSSFRGRSHGRPVDLATTPSYRFVASLQTHDQVGNRARGDRLSEALSVDRLACGAALLLTSPWTPMLFMGEEWGATTPWQFFTDHTDHEIGAATREGRLAEFAGHGWTDEVPDPQDPETFQRSKLDWSELEQGPHDALLHWYRDLIALRRQRPELSRSATDVDHDTSLLRVSRGPLTVLVNLSGVERVLEVGGRTVLAWPRDLMAEHDKVVMPPDSVVVVFDEWQEQPDA